MSRMASTGSVTGESMKWVAPNRRARPSFDARMSTAMILLAPAIRSP